MYKKMSLDDLLLVQNTTFERLNKLCALHKHQFLKGLLRDMVQDTERVFFFEQNKPIFWFYPLPDGGLRLTDEKEHSELVLDADGVDRLHNLLKDKQTMINSSKQKTVFEDLLMQFQEMHINTYMDKPFLVYDIETTFDGRGGDQQFAIAYAIDSQVDHTQELVYQYIDRDWLPAFAQQLLDYPGWIVGFNQISFDNPITMQQGWFDQDALAAVQAKSLDPFQLVRGMCGRRMSLQAMATALLDVGKTLSSGAEGQELLDKWYHDGNSKALEKVKEYCRNDVEITLGVFLYMLRYQDIQIDGKHRTIDEKAWLTYGATTTEPDEQYTDQQVSLFS